MKYKPAAVLFLMIAFSLAVSAQTRSLVFLRYIDNDAEVSQLYDSVALPLLVVGKAVYSIDADCIPRSRSAGSSEPEAKVPNQRNSGGGVTASNKERNSGGGVTAPAQRNTGGGVTAPAARNAGGGVTAHNERNAGGGVSAPDPRNEGGGVSGGCGCAINSSGKFMLAVPAIHKKETQRVYFEHAFLDKKRYKIKII